MTSTEEEQQQQDQKMAIVSITSLDTDHAFIDALDNAFFFFHCII